MRNKTILISGSSVAGPTLAYWLARHGFRPTVVERAASLREGGYAVDVRGAAVEVIERMGLLTQVRSVATETERTAYVDADNRQVAGLSADARNGREGDDLEIMRGDLAKLLFDATQPEVEYLWGESVTSLVSGADGVRVTFEKAAPRTFDLVLGADGLHSNIRGLAFGAESEFVKDLGYYVSIFSTENHLNLDRQELCYNTPGKLAAMYSANGNNEAKAQFYFTSDKLDYDRRDTKAQKRILAEAYAGEGWVVPQLLEAMWDAKDFYFDSVSQVQLDSWSRGRVALVGDAAHCASPLSGMGTDLALVGAYFLAGELKAVGGDYPIAFARYEQHMRDYVAKGQKSAGDNGKWFVPETRGMIGFRNQNIRMLQYMPWKNMITGGASRAAKAVDIKAY